MSVTTDYTRLDEFLRDHPNLEVERVQESFPEFDMWTIRNRRREVRRMLDFGETLGIEDFDINSVAKAGQTAIRAGWFRPISVELKDRPKPKPIWKKAGYTKLVISDIHAPVHDRHALDVAIQVGQSTPIDGIIIAGDGFDAHSVSKYTVAADRPLRWVDERLEAIKPFIEIRESFPDLPIDFLIGNHDIRPLDFIARQAPQLQGLFSIEQLLGIDALGFNVPEGNKVVLADGQLIVKHGVKVSGEAGASVLKEIRTHGLSVIMGHVHRLAYIGATKTAQQIQGKQPIVGVELGCLQNLQPDYLEEEETANWQHGCALVTMYDSGLFNIELIPIHRGTAFFRGRLFQSRFRSRKGK